MKLRTDNTPTVLFTSILTLVLVVPFGIKVFYSEPFPAIFLPSGAYQLEMDNNSFDAVITESYIFEMEHWRSIPAKTLFPLQMPTHLKTVILERIMNEDNVVGLELLDYFRNHTTRAVDSIRLIFREVRIEMNSGKLKSSETLTEKLIY